MLRWFDKQRGANGRFNGQVVTITVGVESHTMVSFMHGQSATSTFRCHYTAPPLRNKPLMYVGRCIPLRSANQSIPTHGVDSYGNTAQIRTLGFVRVAVEQLG